MVFWRTKKKRQDHISNAFHDAKQDYVAGALQDVWVDRVFQNKRNGYFLDFGAFDGVDMSNTLYLERERNWTGICVEPNPSWYPKLCAARAAICINAALWPVSRERLQFVDAHGLSSFAYLKDGDSNAPTRNIATERVIEVDTINPTELMDRFRVSAVIDYLSLDVEGAELDVLKGIDLTRYDIRLMTVEHDCNEERKAAVRSYLAPYGYVGLTISYDDFFFKEDGNYPVSPRTVAKDLGCTDPDILIA